jgi:hypothetical protein
MTKSTRPMLRIHDLATDEIVDREMNDAEYKQHLENLEIKTAREAEAEAKAQAKIVAEGKLAALGLTTDDLRALGL